MKSRFPQLLIIEFPLILERKTKSLRNKEIGLVKVQWQHHQASEWTWEPEAVMRIEPSRVIPCLSDFGDEILLSGGEL